MADEKLKNLHQIGENFFEIEIWFFNFMTDKEYPAYHIPFALVEELVIEETLMNWNTTGYITIKSPYEMLERGVSEYADPAANMPVQKPKLMFRTDGRNRISIRITPFTSVGKLSQQLPPDWEMSHDFVVYDIEDMPPKDGKMENKTKRLYFKDERHQVLSERNLEWSTAAEKEPSAPDSERTMTGSDAIKAILKAAANLQYIDTVQTLNIGFDDQGSIDKPNIPLDKIDEENWDKGPADKKDEIFYTSPAYANVLMDLNYVLSFAKSSDDFPLILDYGRHHKDKSWKLYSLSKIFENSEEKQIEKITIQDGANPTNMPPAMEIRAYEDKNDNTHNFSSTRASFLFSHQISHMAPKYDERFINAPVYNYDFSTGTYNISFKGNKIKDVVEKAKEMCKGLYAFDKKDGQINLTLNPTKLKGVSTRGIYMPQNFYPSDYAGMNMLRDLIFLSDALQFTTGGLTLRAPGKFIYLNHPINFKNNYDDRFLGQWLLTKVTHKFTSNNYTNDVVATKIDNLIKLQEQEIN